MLLEPIQLPISVHVAYYTPNEVVNKSDMTLKLIVCEASSITPRIPASIAKTSKAHHSAHIIAVAGKDMLRYYPQPRIASLSNGTRICFT